MNYQQLTEKLGTISGIPITPFKKGSKEIDWSGVKENIEFLVSNHVEVIVPCGNTSEFYALTLQEAKEIIKKTVEYVDGRALVIAGIGYSVPTAIELGNFSKEAGADGTLLHMPIHPYITNEGAVDYFKNIIEAIDLPSVIYFKNPDLNDEILKELVSLEKLVGVKYAINDLPRFAKTVQTLPSDQYHVAWICGTAEKWAPFFSFAGAAGYTSGLVNVYPQKSLELLQALRDNNYSLIWQVWKELLPFENLREKQNSGYNVVVVKEAMEQAGLNAGVPREPVAELQGEDKQAVADLIRRWNLSIKSVIQ
ncbi:dihydrodipicolinate synthase family protein [Halobacillus andaensis]|uniref:dihydrodipicolinate synthase family protein n=1 Tax=Halobacillus andaensis TaxID=1176239 RepID=UPI003D71AE79